MRPITMPLMRWLNGAVAVALLVQGVHSSDGVAYALATFFGLKALLNLGCCASEGCPLPDRSAQRSSQEMGQARITQVP